MQGGQLYRHRNGFSIVATCTTGTDGQARTALVTLRFLVNCKNHRNAISTVATCS